MTPLIGDVTGLDSWQDAMRATAEAGSLDVLVNNAGTVGSYEPITEIALEDWDRVVRLNQTSVFYGMRTVIPGMVERGRGAVVNVSSMWGIIGASGVAAYQASKGAVTTMTKNAAATYAANGVRINSVHPGLIVTPMTEAQDRDLGRPRRPDPTRPHGTGLRGRRRHRVPRLRRRFLHHRRTTPGGRRVHDGLSNSAQLSPHTERRSWPGHQGRPAEPSAGPRRRLIDSFSRSDPRAGALLLSTGS